MNHIEVYRSNDWGRVRTATATTSMTRPPWSTSSCRSGASTSQTSVSVSRIIKFVQRIRVGEFAAVCRCWMCALTPPAIVAWQFFTRFLSRSNVRMLTPKSYQIQGGHRTDLGHSTGECAWVLVRNCTCWVGRYLFLIGRARSCGFATGRMPHLHIFI